MSQICKKNKDYIRSTPNTFEKFIEVVNLFENQISNPEIFEQKYFHWKK